MGIIYKFTSPSGKSYIGQTIHEFQERIKQHWYKALHGSEDQKTCRALCYAIQLYPNQDDWNMEIILNCDENKLDDNEIYMIAKYNTISPNGYNLTTGGHGSRGYKYTHDDKVTASKGRAKYTDLFEHVYGLRTTSINDPKRGFRVFTDDGKYRSFTFTNWKDEDDYIRIMNIMYERAKKYSISVKDTMIYKPPLSHYIDDLEVPLGIDKCKNGFTCKVFNKISFTSTKNSQLYNLLLTVQHYLFNAPYDSFKDNLQIMKYEYASELYDNYKSQLEEQSSTSLRELVL